MPSKKSRLQLYADECFPVTSVTHLKSLGYSVIHAFDKKLIQKSDATHLKTSRKLDRVLITLDRDFMYYETVNLIGHPGVIVVSVGSAVPPHINKVCKKLLVVINEDFLKDSLIKVTIDKIIKMKEGKVIVEKDL